MRREILRICYKYDGYGHLIGMYLAGEDLSAWPGGISGVFLGNALWCISSYDGQNTEEYLGDTNRRAAKHFHRSHHLPYWDVKSDPVW